MKLVTFSESSNTQHLYFKLPRIIAELSVGITLEAGDIILTGTPSGVGHARTPPEFMKPGDIMETEVEGVGVLRDKIVLLVERFILFGTYTATRYQ